MFTIFLAGSSPHANVKVGTDSDQQLYYEAME